LFFIKKIQFRSPEEYIAGTIGRKTEEEILTPKIDVYTLGNIFYTLLTKERVFQDYHSKDARSSVLKGKFPSVPQEKQAQFSEMEISIFQAMKMCHVFDANSRSSAFEVKQYLGNELSVFNVSFF
jgi:serine/threonine protein kinase